MEFHINQDIICINDDNGLSYCKEGEVYNIKALREAKCKCKNVIEIDVGIRDNNPYFACNICGFSGSEKEDIMWQDERDFQPLDELCDISELTEVLEKPAYY